MMKQERTLFDNHNLVRCAAIVSLLLVCIAVSVLWYNTEFLYGFHLDHFLVIPLPLAVVNMVFSAWIFFLFRGSDGTGRAVILAGSVFVISVAFYAFEIWAAFSSLGGTFVFPSFTGNGTHMEWKKIGSLVGNIERASLYALLMTAFRFCTGKINFKIWFISFALFSTVFPFLVFLAGAAFGINFYIHLILQYQDPIYSYLRESVISIGPVYLALGLPFLLEFFSGSK